MYARKVLALIIVAFFVIAMVLIYDSYYLQPSASGAGLPAVADKP
jgi:hypothetical protein